MKAQSHVDYLWEEAKAGNRKLTPTERRRVLVYLDEIGETRHSNVALAKLFHVTERILRLDKTRLLREFGATLTPAAQVEVLARHLRDMEHLIAVGQRGLQANDAGSLGERFYLETLMKLMKERRETYENTGILRKELGTLNVAEEHWVATVDVLDGALGVHSATPDERTLPDVP